MTEPSLPSGKYNLSRNKVKGTLEDLSSKEGQEENAWNRYYIKQQVAISTKQGKRYCCLDTLLKKWSVQELRRNTASDKKLKLYTSNCSEVVQ